ncbi:serine/threonine protein kinase [Paludisphaera rhizosphaerae]|uniref:serine/threonine protein kinase n=1 Tax=Paludisphaera rhizosphaerae TaxID=2711216 RepID=UPI0013EB8708|nr:serine/threonine protein kinase [Paludisphaera rhizosphaerae]
MPNKVEHPSAETLASYSRGSLDSILLGAITAHLADCQECRCRCTPLSTSPGVVAPRAQSGTPIPPDLALHPDYKIIRELGRGGMGVVYLAENIFMGRKEVLKVVGAHLVKQKTVMDRFLQEIRAAAQLHHPNIVTAFSASRLGESIIFAMEYVEGCDLSRLVEAKGRLDVPIACNFIRQAAHGLQHAYERGMVHRDVKPSNLMVAREGRRPTIKILDFGLAKVSSEADIDSGPTQQCGMMGTPEYVAPEQTKDALKTDIRADVYSLGCTFYCLLAGRPPFSGSLHEILSAHHSVQAKPLNEMRPDVPPALAALVARMMAKSPADRFQTPAEVAAALAPIMKEVAAKSGERAVTHQSPTGGATIIEAPPFGSQSSLGGMTLVERPSPPPGGRTILEQSADAFSPPREGMTVLEAAPFVSRNPLGSPTILEPPTSGEQPEEPEDSSEASGHGRLRLIGAAAACLMVVVVPAGLYLGRTATPPVARKATKTPPNAIASTLARTVGPMLAKTDAPPREPAAVAQPAPRPKLNDESRIVDASQENAPLPFRTPPPTSNLSTSVSEPSFIEATKPAATATTTPTPAIDAASSSPLATAGSPDPGNEIKNPVSLSRLQDEMSDFDGREIEIADILLIGRVPFERSTKYPGGIGVRIDTKEGYNVSLGRGYFDYHRNGGKSEVKLLVDQMMASIYEQEIAELKLRGDGKPEVPTVVRIHVHAPKTGGDAILTIVAMEVLLGYDKVRLAAGELDRNFVAIEASGDNGYSGYVDGAKWVERLGGEKFVSTIRSKVKKARSYAAADRRAAAFDRFFSQVAAASARIVRQNQAEYDARIRALQRGR